MNIAQENEAGIIDASSLFETDKRKSIYFEVKLS